MARESRTQERETPRNFDSPPPGGAMWIAGEASGDALAASVIPSVAAAMGGALQYGIGGPRMREAGFRSWRDSSCLSVRGYVEVLRKIPGILLLRREVIEKALERRPRVFVGVDAPDFNLGVELSLRRSGLRTVHFVSPSIWAWRPERIHKIRAACDRVLLVFPFEKAIYDEAGIDSVYVGHPMASIIPVEPDTMGARARLSVGPESPIVAILPGSRADEVRWNGPVFFETAREVIRHLPEVVFIVPASDSDRMNQIESLLSRYPDVSARTRLFAGRSHDVLEACDAVLLASGTAALEAALYKKPMVVGYRMPALSSVIMQRKGNTSYVSLPNILAGRRLVPEFLQYFAQPRYMAVSLVDQLDPKRREELLPVFTEMHESLIRDTANLAAEAIADAASM